MQMMYRIHLIEGTSFKKYTENNELVEDFVADKANTYIWVTATSLLSVLQQKLNAKNMTLEWLQQALDAGSTCLVIDHSDKEKGKINLHIMPEPEATGMVHTSPAGTLQ